MRLLKKISIAGAIAAVVIPLSVAFVYAKGKPANAAGPANNEQQAQNNNSDLNKGMAESAQQSVQTYRAQGQARAAEQRQNVQERLAEIEDKVKQRLATQLASQFDHINKVWTDHFAQLLDRYDAILQKVQDRASIAASNGKDISSVTAKIQSAKDAIASARTAVQTQAAKTYTPSVSTPSPSATASASAGQEQLMRDLRASFKALREQLFKDLFALRNGPMTDARKAVQSAIQTLGQIPGVDQSTATSSPKPKTASESQ